MPIDHYIHKQNWRAVIDLSYICQIWATKALADSISSWNRKGDWPNKDLHPGANRKDGELLKWTERETGGFHLRGSLGWWPDWHRNPMSEASQSSRLSTCSAALHSPCQTTVFPLHRLLQGFLPTYDVTGISWYIDWWMRLYSSVENRKRQTGGPNSLSTGWVWTVQKEREKSLFLIFLFSLGFVWQNRENCSLIAWIK